MLPQVLAGLGTLSIASAGCLVWLSRLQPFFAALAVGALAYQGWLVWRRPRYQRTRGMLLILWTSIGTNAVIVAGLFGLWLRYR